MTYEDYIASPAWRRLRQEAVDRDRTCRLCDAPPEEARLEVHHRRYPPRGEWHLDCLDALQSCLNVGTLSGAPKLRATELLREYEATKRGPYGGAVGWLSGTGEMDTGVVIRSAVVKDGQAYVRAGAGVVHDSDPQAETEETKQKASAVLAALRGDDR